MKDQQNNSTSSQIQVASTSTEELCFSVDEVETLNNKIDECDKEDKISTFEYIIIGLLSIMAGASVVK